MHIGYTPELNTAAVDQSQQTPLGQQTQGYKHFPTTFTIAKIALRKRMRKPSP